jgi:hypothetical protein
VAQIADRLSSTGILKNFQTWSLWVDDVRYAQDFGFRDPVPAFSLIQLEDPDALDDVSVDTVEPPNLDNDGDGLTNAEELALGTDPDNPDTSGDGVSDYVKVTLGLDPLSTDTFFATLESDGQGGYYWHTAFTAAEGYLPGGLDGQNDWFAEHANVSLVETARFRDSAFSFATLERFFDVNPHRQVWISFRAQMEVGVLPAPPVNPGEPLALAFGFSTPDTLNIWDAASNTWQATTLEIDSREWNEYALFLDYETRNARERGQLI